MTISKIKVGNTEHDLHASRLTIPRTFSLTGDATGSATFDGSGNVSITVAVQDNSHNHTPDQVGAYSKAEVNAALNKKMDDFSIEIYNGTSGNPKPVRFASFNYSTCGSEEGIAAKISMVSGHGNGSSYAFLQDAIIKVTHLGGVEVDNFKHYGASAGSYDGANRQYGDIFWLTDTTNKIIDFYVLMGQYARMYQTPWKRLTYSTKGTVTQHTSCTVYSSGTKTWGNNSNIALESKFNDYYNKAETDKAIDDAIDVLVGAAPGTLDTLEELADALKDNPAVVDALNESISKKADRGTTLSAYGITDAYTKTNTYSKTEVDGIVQNYYSKTDADNRFVNTSGDTMTGNFLIEKANPYVGFKDTGYSTLWYMQAYQDQFGFGPSWTSAVKSDKNGNMTVPGTIKVGNAVTLQYNSSNACLDFIF